MLWLQGLRGNPGPQGDPGIDGFDGEKGYQGDAIPGSIGPAGYKVKLKNVL